jgi:hypothetical protein
MVRKYYIKTFILVFGVILSIKSQDVTFNVDLNGSVYPTSNSHILRIVANPGGTSWDGNFLELTDSNNDGIYSGTVSGVVSGQLLFQVRQGEPGSTSWGAPILPSGCDTLEFDGANYVIAITQNTTIDFKIRGCLASSSSIKRWDFNDLVGWVDASQNVTNPQVSNYGIVTNSNIGMTGLEITTAANTFDRPKVRTIDRTYTYGRYYWRVYIAPMGAGDKASVGAFLYNDDTHELDFEIGYGTAVKRQELNAASDDLVMYLTSQGNPSVSVQQLIKNDRWYTFSIELLENNGNYEAIWYVDNVEVHRLNLTYGGLPFGIFCSVENLHFMGDQIPQQNNYAVFDYVEFNNLKYTKTPYILNKN